MRTLLIVLASMCFVSCGGKKPPVVQPTIVREVQVVEVKVPVPTVIQPPPELLQPIKIPLPVFVAPSDPKASSALTAEGERLLRGMLEELAAWREAVLAYWKTLAEK